MNIAITDMIQKRQTTNKVETVSQCFIDVADHTIDIERVIQNIDNYKPNITLYADIEDMNQVKNKTTDLTEKVRKKFFVGELNPPIFHV